MLLVVPHLNCNLFCYYCYEGRYRQKHKTRTMDYNLEIMLKRMEDLKDLYPEMCLHGGEPLIMKKEDVRKLLLKMKELTGKSGIQTNGTLIDDDYIQIFKECSTAVGLSYDGPGELSKYRLYRLKNKVDIEQKIEKMIEEGIEIGMIMVISKANAGTDRLLRKLKQFLLKADKMRISGRLNPCGCAPEYELDEKRLIKAYLDLADFCLHHNLRWSPFTDIINGLQGKPRVCTFSGCDIFSTPSAAELLGDGSLTNCMRVNQEYILLRHPLKYDTRKEILAQTPQEFGGCQGCQYWHACYGGCPTMTIDGDWRNRTYLCSLWKALFLFYGKILAHCGISFFSCGGGEKSTGIAPEAGHGDSPHCDSVQGDETEHTDSTHGDRIEHADSDHGDRIEHGDSAHGDSFHTDLNHGDSNHGDAPHGDAPHGDSAHGDSGHGDRAEHADSDHGDSG